MKPYKIKFSPAIFPELQQAAKTTGLKKSEIIEIALIELFWDKSKWIICPTCESYLAIRDAIDGDEPVKRYLCGCGTRVLYDTVEEQVIR
jgi:hypothetical protein